VASLSLSSVSKVFERELVVANVSLEVADGEFIVLVGPSGCGKSTTLRMIAGLEAITSGTIRIGERTVNGIHPADRDVAMVFQSYALYPHMSVFDNLAYGLRRRRLARSDVDRRVAAAAAMLKLGGLLRRRPAQLSGGQRQRVALGRAIVREPSVFLMDEPLSNLDAKLRVEMRGELAQLHARLKVTTVYVTHDQVEAMTMGDRIVVMNAGRIEQTGKPLDLYRRPATLFVARFLGLPEMNLVNGELREAGEKMCFVGEGLPAPIPVPCAGRSGAVVLGVRPQSLFGMHTGVVPPARTPLGSALVLAVEHHGPESFASCQLGTAVLTAEISPGSGIGIGDRISLCADLSDLHLFDPATGLRLEERAPTQLSAAV
jgi:ABC-type sugar transport system ATPase subunit